MSEQRFTRPDVAADLVKDIIKQKVEDVKQARAAAVAAKKRRNRLPLLLGLLPLLIGLTLWNVLRAGHQPVVISPADRVASLKFKIYIAAEAIEAYRTTHGVIPANLKQVGADMQGLTYVPGDTTWSIVGRVDSTSITYRHGQPLGAFSSAYQPMQRRRR